MASSIFHMLAKVRRSPARYIGKPSIEALWFFLMGYSVTAELESCADVDMARYRIFIDGLHTKYGRGDARQSWAKVLTQAAGGDAPGFDLFFAELEAFQKKGV